MNFDFHPDLAALRTEVRTFIRENLPAGVRERFRRGMPASSTSRRSMSLQLAGRLVARRCATDRARALLAPVISGQRHLALATSEPRSRFEPRIVDTTATAAAGGYAISGEKRIVAWAEAADRIVVTARTAGGRAETRGISLFVIDRDAAGVSEKRYRTVDGHRASDLRLDGVRVPPDALLGEPDTAFDDLETVCDHATPRTTCVASCRSTTIRRRPRSRRSPGSSVREP